MKISFLIILTIFSIGLFGCAKNNSSSSDSIVAVGKIYKNTKTDEVFDEYYNLQFRLDKDWCDEYVVKYYQNYSYGKQLDELESCLLRLGYERVTEQTILPPHTSPFISSFIIKRVKELNDMRDKGLINEEDYQEKKEEILSQ